MDMPEQPPLPIRELPQADDGKQPKACRDCGEMRPLSEFGRDRQQPDGKKTICKACWAMRTEEAKAKSKAALQHKFSKEFSDSVINGKAIPETPDLLEGIIHAFGGVGAFCKEFVADYFASEPGSASRKRSQEVVTRLTERHTSRVFGENDIRAMTDEELEAVLQNRMQSAVVKMTAYQDRKRKAKEAERKAAKSG